MPKNETLILFFEKIRFIRAYICWFFIACVLPSKFHPSLIPFVGNISYPELRYIFFTDLSRSRFGVLSGAKSRQCN